MIEFIYHSGIEKEIIVFKRQFHLIKEAFEIFERLCNRQFNPSNPEVVIAPAKLHRVHQNEVWSLWKIELSVPKSGLRPNQFPRVWFAVHGTVMVFLCMATHINNYSDEEMNHLALSRVTDVF